MLEEDKTKGEVWLGAATACAQGCSHPPRYQLPCLNARLSGSGGYSLPASPYITAMDIRQQTVYARPADIGPSHGIGRIALCFAFPTGAKISTCLSVGGNLKRKHRPLPTLDYRYQGLFSTFYQHYLYAQELALLAAALFAAMFPHCPLAAATCIHHHSNCSSCLDV